MKTMIKNKKTGVVLEGTMNHYGNVDFHLKIDGTSSYNTFCVKDWDIIPKVPQNPGAVIQHGEGGGGYVRGRYGEWRDLTDLDYILKPGDLERILSQLDAKVVFEGIPQ